MRPSDGQIAALEALTDAAEAALRLSRCDRSPETLATLAEHRDALRQARPAFTAYAKSLPINGRPFDPACAANAEAGRILGVLGQRLRGSTSGTPRESARVETNDSMNGMIGRAEQVLNQVEREIESGDVAAMLNLWGVRHAEIDMWLISRRELRTQTDALVAEIDRAVRQLNDHFRRYETQLRDRYAAAEERYSRRGRDEDRPGRVQDAHDDAFERVDALRERARALRVEIVALPERPRQPSAPQPVHRPYER